MWEKIVAWLKRFADQQNEPLLQLIANLRTELSECHAEIRKLHKTLPAIPVGLIPDKDVGMITVSDMYGLLVTEHKLGLTYGGLLDSDYWFPTHYWWVKIVTDIVEKIPPWVKDRQDCDDFGQMMKGIMAFYYGFNACGIMDGEMYVDYLPGKPADWMGHNWFSFIDDTGMWSVERNGEIWKTGTHAKYKEKRIYI